MELIKNLVSQLGVSEDQAQGGLGSILKFAQDNLGNQDFSKISELVGGSDKIMDKAPAAEGFGSMIGGIASSLGVGGNLGSLAVLASQFSKIGLDADMIAKFAPIVTNFLQTKGGDQISGVVSKLLSGK